MCAIFWFCFSTFTDEYLLGGWTIFKKRPEVFWGARVTVEYERIRS